MSELETLPNAQTNDMTLSDPGIVQMAARAEKLVAALKIIRAAVLKLTNEKDWDNLGDKPYLNEGGAKKVGTAFGVSWQLDEPKREDYEDGHYDYYVSGEFEFRGTKCDEVGTRSSRDDFFAKKSGRIIPASEIDRNDVKKGAVTNCIGRGVKSILALKNFTWDELKAAGIDKEKVASVSYGGPTVPFGKDREGNDLKGKALTDAAVTKEFLAWLKQSIAASVKDPKKADFKAKNEKLLKAIDDELHRRKDEASQESATASQERQPTPADDGGANCADSASSGPPPELGHYKKRIREASTEAEAKERYEAVPPELQQDCWMDYTDVLKQLGAKQKKTK